MRPNKIKQMWRDGKCVTLGWLSVSHGFTAEVMARQGFDALPHAVPISLLGAWAQFTLEIIWS